MFRLSHSKATAYFPTQQRFQISLLLLRCAMGNPDLHIAGVGGLADDEVIVMFFHGIGVHPERVGSGMFRLSHSKATAYFPTQQRFQISVLLLRCAVSNQDLHIAGVGGLAVEYIMAQQAASEH